MAESSHQSLSGRSGEPRAFTKSEIRYVHKSSPPEPYLTFNTGPHPLRRLIIKIWSQDQGQYDDQHDSDQPLMNSHTGFALGIVHENSYPLRPPNETFLCQIQRNACASVLKKCHILEWRLNTPIERDQSDEDEAQGWLELISSGSCVEVGLFPLATYSYWVNVVHQVTVELYDETDTTLLPVTASVLDQTSSRDSKMMSKSIDSLGRRFQQTGSIEDLTRVIEATQKGIEALPDNYPHLASYLIKLGMFLNSRYTLTHSMDDLTKAISVGQEAINVAPDNHPRLAGFLCNLALSYITLYEQTHSIHDLERSIELTMQAFEMPPDGHQSRCEFLISFALQLEMRYRHTRSFDDLTRAIEIDRMAIESTCNHHPELVEIVGNLGKNLDKRYKATGQIDDLSNAIEIFDRAIKTVPEGHASLPGYLNNFGAWLSDRFRQTGSLEDLERAIKVARKAVEATADSDPEALVRHLANLGTMLGSRSELTDSTNDLDTAISLTERAVALMPENHPDFASVYSNLGNWLSHKSDQSGSTDSLAKAIEVNQDAIKAAHDNPTDDNVLNRARYLNNLGESLFKRYDRTGSAVDLTRAIETIEEAVRAATNGYRDLATIFSNLAVFLTGRFERIGSADDLERAVEAAEKAVEATPHRHKALAGNLNNLGIQLAKRYKHTEVMGDLMRAIEVTQQAEQAASTADLVTLPLCLTNLGNWLHDLYEQTRSMDDLNRATEAAQKAVDATPDGHTYRAIFLGNLGNRLGRRYAQTSLKADQDAQLSAYAEGSRCTTSPPFHRIRLANDAASINASRAEWDEAYILQREAVLLLPKLSPRSLEQIDMQHMLSSTSGLGTHAAAMALNAGKDVLEAVSILELGRGVISGLLIDTRGDLSGLRGAHPSLADRFEELRTELDSPKPNSGSMVELSIVNRRHQATRELDEVIEQIRARDGFHDFLQPPSADSLMSAAESGPIVVVNVSWFRCDAFLVERETVRLLELPGLTLKNVVEYVKKIRSSKHNPWPLLEWLWTTVCRPCLDALGFTEPVGDGQWPHVWWVPTGPLSELPLHAAGIYTPGSKETVLDRVVSSYASSIKALQHGRQQQKGVAHEGEQQKNAILVAMEQTQGQMSLPNARTEIDKVSALCPLLNLNATTPPRRKADILEHLKHCKILHFAGHGVSSNDPSQSFLLLDDWKTDPLTFGNLRESWLQESPAFLAYLSACSTGNNQGRGLSDESIHLVSAFQLAGFRHVVGTLWEVSDPHCVDVATVLYQTLCDEGMTDEAVSYGLHRAVRKLRDDSFREGSRRDIVLVGEEEGQTPGSSVNTFWIPYIHFGA